MKFTVIFLSFLFVRSSFAFPIKDYSWSVTDIAELGLKKEQLFSEMDRDFINLGSSICANRALMWLYDFKKDHNINGAKIFLFYTNQSHGIGLRRWWYHVSPIISENGQLYVMDAGFSSIKSPLTPEQWMNNFSRGGNCKEIEAQDDDLISYMNSGQQFPTQTRHGKYHCYYKIVPAGLWFPRSVHDSLTGGNVPNEIQEDEVYHACREAVTSPLGGWLNLGKKKCRKYLSH